MAKGKYADWITPDGLEQREDNGNCFLTIEQAVSELKKPMRFSFVGNEKAFEDEIVRDIEEICEGLFLPPVKTKDRQRLIKVSGFHIKPDILVRHEDGTMTIFEVKKTNEKYPATGTTNQLNAVGQLLLYGNVIEQIIKAPVRLALIDNKIYYRTFCAFDGYGLPITLIEYQNGRIFVPYNGWHE